MRKFFILPILCTLALPAAGIFISGFHYGIFADSISLAIVICPVLFLLMTHFSFKDMGRAFFLAMKKTKGSISDIRQAITFFKTMLHLLIFSGLSSTFFGIIGLLSDIKQSENIGRWLAASSLALYYSILLIGLVAIPFKSALEKKLAEVENPVSKK